MDSELREHRQHLILAEQKAQDDYDKAVLALSGGGLGVSMAFIEKVIGEGEMLRPGFLSTAWLFWAASIAAVLLSYFLSRHALRCAISQVDGARPELRRIGGKMSLATETCNVVSGVGFVAGAVLIAIFAVQNLEAKNAKEGNTPTPVAGSPGTSGIGQVRVQTPTSSPAGPF